MKPVIPVLTSDTQRLSRPVDIVKYILRHYMSAPKNINDTFAGSELSFIYDVADFGHDKVAITNVAQAQLLGVLNRYFPMASSVSVSVDTEDIDAVRYNVIFDILVVINGIPYSIADEYSVDSKGNLQYAFKGE